MELYHHTNIENFARIRIQGLKRGVDLPTSLKGLASCANVVWLTSDADGSAHGLGETEDCRRMCIKFQFSDANRKPGFLEHAHEMFDRDTLERVIQKSGGNRKVEKWHLYFSDIPADCISRIYRRMGDGSYEECSDSPIKAGRIPSSHGLP